MIFQYINNTKLRRKLFVAFFTFTCIIILVAGMSFWFYSKRDNIQIITSEIESITTDVLKLVKLEGDFFEQELQKPEFFKTGKSSYHKKNRELMIDIQKRIQFLLKKPEIREFEVVSKLTELSNELVNYEKKFNKTVQLYFEKGSKNEGLEGRLREIAQSLEKSEGMPMVVLLNLRRYEKDYIMHKDSSSVALFNIRIQEAKRVTPIKYLPQLEEYERSFKQMLEIDKRLGISSLAKGGLRIEMREHSENAIRLIEITSGIVEKKVMEMRGEFQNIFVITLLIVIVLSLTFSYFLSFFMTIPVTELSRSMQKAIEMNFSEDLKPARKYTNDEIGILTDEFNLMIKRIQEQFKEIKSNASLLESSNKELQETNLQLAESEKRLEKFLLLKETLFSSITQGLKSPLNSLKGFLSLMQNYPDTFTPQELAEVAGDMYLSFDKITVLINSLVQWSQTQTGDLAYNPNQFNISNLLEQVITQYSQMAKSKNIKIINHIKQQDIIVNADKDMINFTLRNLLSNAIKFTHEGGQVEIFARPRGKDMIMFTFKDNGVGINEELLEKIFLPEVHVSMLGTNNEKGSGLGLMMCKDFIQKNEGKLYIESEVNKGTSVHFTLKKAGV